MEVWKSQSFRGCPHPCRWQPTPLLRGLGGTWGLQMSQAMDTTALLLKCPATVHLGHLTPPSSWAPPAPHPPPRQSPHKRPPRQARREEESLGRGGQHRAGWGGPSGAGKPASAPRPDAGCGGWTSGTLHLRPGLGAQCPGLGHCGPCHRACPLLPTSWFLTLPGTQTLLGTSTPCWLSHILATLSSTDIWSHCTPLRLPWFFTMELLGVPWWPSG